MDTEKFKNAVLAILKAKPGMGSLQLRKALIIADALHKTLHGESITGATYIKYKYGPVPNDEAFLLLMQMSFPLQMVEIIEVPVGQFTQNSYRLLVEPNYDIFTRSQIDILNYAALTAYKYTASLLSYMTHMGNEIPLDTVCKMTISGYDTKSFSEEEKIEVRRFFESDEARLFEFV
ncbi:MAG: hypothetical protein Ta2C_10960 [Candidatus Endomicrobiellum trichonymphae]|uniref:Panacea domain-containing protein n=1 Tax=Endomicrobium trichonymphae TaxID=1408204 RepID=UPI0027D41258|nr:MAG: hypothetical protein Ta2C_10960 [Candidatus Endomicrobium trichonymphae]